MKRAWILLILICLACGKEQPGSLQDLIPRPDLESSVLTTPSKLVGISASISIGFREAMIPDHLIDQVLLPNPFAFEPGVQGEAKWADTRLLVFQPSEGWPAGKEIRGTLIAERLLPGGKSKDFSFQFKVAEQEVLSLTGDVEPLETGMHYHGQIRFAQSVDPKAVERDIRVRGVRAKIRVSRAEDDLIHFWIGPIQRGKGRTLTVSLPAAYTADRDSWEALIYIPGEMEFQVLTHKDMTESGAPAASVGFVFSEKLPDTDLSGYVHLDPEMEYRTRVSGKTLILEGDFQPGQKTAVLFRRGFPSASGSRLSADRTFVVSRSNLKPQIRWISPGIFLPSDNRFRLQFESVNVSRISVRVIEIFQQNIGFFLQQNVLEDRSRQRRYAWDDFSYMDLERVGEEILDQSFEITDARNRWIRNELNLEEIFKGKNRSIFVVQMVYGMNDLVGRCTNEQSEDPNELYYDEDDWYSNPCSEGYYYSNGTLSRLIIASDIGLTMKKTAEGIACYAVHSLNARPIKGLKLSLYSQQNRLLGTDVTDGDGYCVFDQQGSYVYGESKEGIALLQIQHGSWELDGSETEGRSGIQKGLDAFVYTERGVYRPGDTLMVSAIIRNDREKPNAKQPLIFRVKNSRDQTVFERKTECGDGHVAFVVPTRLEDPTGIWTALFQVGDATFSRAIRIETIKPNRLSVEHTFQSKIGAQRWTLQGDVKVKYLFGAPAANLGLEIRLDLEEGIFRPKGYEKFQFKSPARSFQPRSQELIQASLDQDGKYKVQAPLPALSEATGSVLGTVHIRVLEKGGGATETRHGILLFPFASMAGVRIPEETGPVKTDSEIALPVIILDPDGRAVAGHAFRVRVFLNKEYWWYDYDGYSDQDFRNLETTRLAYETTLISQTKPVPVAIRVESEGSHFVEITDMGSGHETGFQFQSAEWGWTPAGEASERNMLAIESDKTIYRVGETAKFRVATPSEGMVLMTLEQGESILEHAWKPVRSGKTEFQVTMTESMIPNFYVSMSLIQPHNQNTNDLPMRLYGIKTIFVEKSETRLGLILNAPDRLEPEQEFSLTVTSRSTGPASFTVAVVDEGLLSLTAFETPSPWDYFYQKVRLGVETIDNYSEIMGILYPDMERYFSIGGGLMAEAMAKRLDTGSVRRFKPVVLFAGPLSVDPGKSKTIRLKMPNYQGAVRVMVVGASNRAYGKLEKTIPVSKPLMVLPTAPRVVRPGDSFALPVSIFADKPMRVSLSARTGRSLQVIPPEKTVLDISSGETARTFSIKAGESLKADTIWIEAISGEMRAHAAIPLPLISSNPFRTDVRDTLLQAGGSLRWRIEKFGIEGTNQATLALSRMPDVHLDRHISFLIRYPYGCIEQITSAAMAQLFLPRMMDLTPADGQAVTDHVHAAMERLKRHIIQDGFSYWPVSENSEAYPSDWGTTYAGHFLLEAKALGYHVPPDLLAHWKASVKRNVRNSGEDLKSQAYRLFALSLDQDPDVGAMNRLRENGLQKMDPLSKALLAAAVHLAGQPEEAQEILQTAGEPSHYRELGGSYGSDSRDRALMAYLAVLMKDDRTTRLMTAVIRDLGSGKWFSTQERAMGLLALGRYAETNPWPGGRVRIQVDLAGNKETINLDQNRKTVPLEGMWSREATLQTDGPLYVSLMREGIPLREEERPSHEGLELTRRFFDLDGNPLDVRNLDQGRQFWIVYSIVNGSGLDLENIAFSSLFPAGWEILPTRLLDEEYPYWLYAYSVTDGDFCDIRDDRINWFFSLDAGMQISFAAKLTASYQGEFSLPAVAAEAMYDPAIHARIQGDRVRISAAKTGGTER